MRMDAERSQGLPPRSRVKKLLVFLFVQILLVAACVLANLYIYWSLQQLASEKEVHMQLGAISDIRNNRTLQFQEVSSSSMMALDEETKTKILVSCTGPYMLYMDVCYISLDKAAQAVLQLEVVGRALPLCSFPFSNKGCERLHSIVYLQVNEKASLKLFTTGDFKIKNISVGLNYELGRRCEF